MDGWGPCLQLLSRKWVISCAMDIPRLVVTLKTLKSLLSPGKKLHASRSGWLGTKNPG